MSELRLQIKYLIHIHYIIRTYTYTYLKRVIYVGMNVIQESLGVVKPTADLCVIGSTSDTTSNYPGHHRYHEFTLLSPLCSTGTSQLENSFLKQCHQSGALALQSSEIMMLLRQLS